MSKFRFILPAVIAAAGILVPVASISAKSAYMGKTKKQCAYCHVDAKNKPKELTAAGKCYGEKKSLEGCPTN
jgi:hypothetical protein